MLKALVSKSPQMYSLFYLKRSGKQAFLANSGMAMMPIKKGYTQSSDQIYPVAFIWRF